VSQLLDSLRRQGRTKPPRSGPSPSVKGDAVLATLGYVPARSGAGVSRVAGAITVLALAAIGWYGWTTFRDEPIQQVARPTPARGVAAPSPVPASSKSSASEREPLTPVPAPTVPLAAALEVKTASRPPVSASHAKTQSPKPAPASPPASPPAAQPPAGPLPAATGDTGLVSPAVDHWTQALYYQKDGDFDNALKHYAALLDKEPMNAQVRNNLGMLYQQRGMLAQAVREFQRALNIDRRYVRAHNNLGVAYLAQRNVDAAAAQFRAALDIDRRNVDAMVNLAIAEKALGQRARAKEGLLRALTIDPRSPTAHYNLGVLCDETGEAALAMQHYRSFLENANTDNAGRAVEVRARLDTLGRVR